VISRYSGKCYICGDATKAGVDQYDVANKRSYHQHCHDNVVHIEEPATADDAGSLADKLGFAPRSPHVD